MGRVVRRNPRVAVTLSPEANELVGRMAKSLGQRKASILADLIDTMLPALEKIGDALVAAQTAPLEAQRVFSTVIDESLAGLQQAQLELPQVFDGRTVKGKRRARRAAANP